MNHANLFLALIHQRASDIDRRAQMLGPLLAALADEPAPAATEPLTVRLGHAADWPALGLVAELDSSSLPAAPLLVGERDGRLIAALSLSDGTVVANPFVPSADVVALLELRARQISRQGHRRPRRAIAWRLSRAGN
jgi:hypothetical protein